MYKYDIGGKKYIQKPLVLGQVKQIIDLMKNLIIPADIDTKDLIMLFGDRLPNALAIVLTEENQRLQDKDINSLTEELIYSASPEIALAVVRDFFDCNQISSLFDKITEMTSRISESMNRTNGLTSSSVTSPAEISQKENRSSGDAR